MARAARCVPPAEATERRYHWLDIPGVGDHPSCWEWDGSRWWDGEARVTPEQMAAKGWVHVAPCLYPAEVAALVEKARAEPGREAGGG